MVVLAPSYRTWCLQVSGDLSSDPSLRTDFVFYLQASAFGKGSHGEQDLGCLKSSSIYGFEKCVSTCKAPFFVQLVNVAKPME